jgi:hypothetical protein
MNICDKITDAELTLIAHALRRYANYLIERDLLGPEFTREQVRACKHLLSLCPEESQP